MSKNFFHLTSFFRPNTAAISAGTHHSMAEPPQPISRGNPNLTTSVHRTHLGLFSLTWSRTFLGRALLLHNPFSAADDDDNTSLSPSSFPASFHLLIRPFIFWNKNGSKKLSVKTAMAKTKVIQIFWDLSSAKFGSRPEPQSGYYIAVVVDGEMILLVGDSPAEAYAKTRASKPERGFQSMVLRREHVYGNKLYTTKANFGGKTRDISIDCRIGSDDTKLCFSVDNKRVLQVKHLKWKFRGNERIEVEGGACIQISWDVYNWLFDDEHEDGYVLFMFRFEKLGFEVDHEDEVENLKVDNGGVLWSQESCGFGFEKKKMKRRLLRTAAARSSSSSSISSAASSSGCSSVMEWASVEENELKGPSEFSLLVYAWKR